MVRKIHHPMVSIPMGFDSGFVNVPNAVRGQGQVETVIGVVAERSVIVMMMVARSGKRMGRCPASLSIG